MLTSLLAIIFAWLSGSAVIYMAADEQNDRLFDARLQDLARTVISFAEHEILEIQNEGRADRVHRETEATLGSRYQYQIWNGKGELLLRSHNASDDRPIAPLSQLGFSDQRWEMQEYRTFAMMGPLGQFKILVAEHLDERNAVVGTPSWYFFLFLVLSFVLVMSLSWFLLRSAMKALDESAAQLLSRSPDELTQLQVKNPPAELMPMLVSINKLLGRVEHTLAQERGFTATAAHELRTPLSALRLQAQVAARAKTKEERDLALSTLMECVDRASHLLDQLLALAKLDDLRQQPLNKKPIEVGRLFESLMLDQGPAAAVKSLRFKTYFHEPLIFGIEPAVSMLLRNLIANAVKYTPEGGSIVVGTEKNDNTTVLTVEDSGPGIPAAERERVFERFYRLEQTRQSSAEGVGLGLTIVQSVVQTHRAELVLDESILGGLRFEVHFPS